MGAITKIKIAVLVGLCLGCFGGGYELRDLMAEADKVESLEQSISKSKENAEISVKAETAYVDAEEKTKIVYKTITKEVPKYVSVIQSSDGQCNLSNGTVRLLNSAIDNQLPQSATGVDEADKTASKVRESDLINHSQESINQYNETMNQCNALISWVKDVHDANKLY